jgi:ABC-type transporter Mla subunit MlaD
MIKKILFMLAVLLAASPVMAQDYGAQPVVAKKIGEVRALGEARADLKEKINVVREEAKEKVAAGREKIKEGAVVKRAETKEKVNAAREATKERLLKVRDAKKRSVVERTEKELARLNERMSGILGKAVKQIASVLKRIEERIEKVKSLGRNVENVLPMVDVAKKAIVAAEEALKAQSAKTYTISNPDDQTLRVDVQKLKQLLKDDLQLIHELIKTARTAVHDVAVALAQVSKPTINELENKAVN